MNDLPVFQEMYTNFPNVRWLKGRTQENSLFPAGHFQEIAGTEHLSALLEEFKTWKPSTPPSLEASKSGFQNAWANVIRELSLAAERRGPLPRHMPPILREEDCPPISIVTLVHNRPKFVENACLNLLSTDYPKSKIEWVVVDDSDATESASNRILSMNDKLAPGTVKYVPLVKKKTIGEKRNIGVEKASHDIILMMDDDDHYPSTSFRRRVAWLLKGRTRPGCAVCTTIAMYDLLQGTSAVNVPPYSLSLAKRCSEATLTFTRAFWKARPFGATSSSEGEAFLEGRENEILEMPPQQIIVALNHGKNISGRSVTKDDNAGKGCFWGFPKELLIFLHGLAGVRVEEEK